MSGRRWAAFFGSIGSLVFLPSLGCTGRAAPTEQPRVVGRGYRALWLDVAPARGVADNTERLRPFLAAELTEADRKLFSSVLPFVRSQIDRTASELPPGHMPMRTDPATGAWITASAGSWTSGHWVGLLWEAYRLWGDPAYRARALAAAEQISVAAGGSTSGHDHGFLFGLSHVKGMSLLPDGPVRSRLRAGALEAARTYTAKLDPGIGLIHWHGSHEQKKQEWQGTSVIDSMMNIPLMWWASEQTGEERFREVGRRQADGMRRYCVRKDFSTAHGVDFSPRDGTFLRRRTHQGRADDSTWTRGQAWAIYGFTVVYAKTGDKEYLTTARGLADYYLNHPRLTPDLVPVWDFSDTAADAPRDSSAGATVAAALQSLARFEDDPERAKTYMRKSIAALRSLSGPPWLARGTSDRAILRHGCQHYPRDIRDNGLIFGDYYYVEALVQLLGW